MKIYSKPEIEIIEFDVVESVTATGSDLLPGDAVIEVEEDGVFFGIEAGEEGYLINQ